jgi:hypothetical protein
MDYAIYKTINGSRAHVVHRFTQADNNHQAKRAAQEKLKEMWLRIVRYGFGNKRIEGSKPYEFSYDYIAAEGLTQRIRFYIAAL